MGNLLGLLNPLDLAALRKQALTAKPFPHFYIDNFLNEEFANEVYSSFPEYNDAIKVGREFKAVNEVKKVQVTDSKLFPEPIKKLNELLASQDFIDKLGYILDIPDLVADPTLSGGGIHETSEGGRLDVHVDFNFNEELGLFRRVNILLYFNKDWKKEYGGILDLWDSDVKKCYTEILPIFNRLACFATSEISYHGVTPVTCPEGMARKSFAAYYYTTEASKDWDGTHHSTIFKARPDEWVRGHVYMPAEKTKRELISYKNKAKSFIKKMIGYK